MAPITWAMVVAQPGGASLAAVDPGAQDDILAMVNVKFAAVFDGEDGPTTKLARLYFAAHFASSSVGIVLSETRGGLSRTYQGVPTTGSDELDTTPFGRRYKQLLIGSRAAWPRTP